MRSSNKHEEIDLNCENGAFISGKHLRELVEDHGVLLNETKQDTYENVTLDWDSESNWAVDLALGEEIFISSEKEIRRLEASESIAIDPGDFAVLSTDEIIDMPSNITALISLRFKYKLRGLINVSGFHIDPNYCGRVIFAMYNAGPSPVYLRRGDEPFMITFANISDPIKGNRHGGTDAEMMGIEPDLLSGLQGRTASLENLDDRVNELQNRQRILIAISIGILIGLIGMILGGGINNAFA